MHAVAEADPLQKICDVLLVIGNAFSHDPQGQCDVLPRRQVIEQAKVLEHDADAPAQLRAFCARDTAHILIEEVNFAARWVQRHEQQTQKRTLAGARRPGKKVERARPQMEIDLGEHIVPLIVGQG